MTSGLRGIVTRDHGGPWGSSPATGFVIPAAREGAGSQGLGANRGETVIRTTLALALLVLASCGSTGGRTKDVVSIELDCTVPDGSCETWYPAVSPFDGTYSSHSCLQWKDAPDITVHASSLDNCVVAEGAQEGTESNPGTGCPEAARVGGCMVTSPSTFCEITYFYADETLVESSRANADEVRQMCEEIGGVFVD